MNDKLEATVGLERYSGRGSGNISSVYEAITDARSNRTTADINLIYGLQ